MHARQLVEVAAIVANQGPGLVCGATAPPSDALEQYWTHSKCRLDRWIRALKRYVGTVESGHSRPGDWSRLRPVVEEILSGELLTRVWSAVLYGFDQRHKSCAAAPIARSVLVGHVEARHRAMALLVEGPGVGTEEAVALNRLRRRTERWTDLLLGYVQQACDVKEVAIDASRMNEFAEDIQHQLRRPGGHAAWPLTLASLRMAYQCLLEDPSPNADLNARIAATVLGCFPPDQFESTGLFRSLWLQRLINTAHDAEGLLDDLLGDDRPCDATKSTAFEPGTFASDARARRRPSGG